MTVKFWLTETVSRGYSFDKEELRKHYLANEPRVDNPDDDELYDYFQGEFDIDDLEQFDSFEEFEENVVGGQDICDIDCRMAFNKI